MLNSVAWQMGSYGIYVWSAYSIGLGVLLINLILPCLRRRRLLKHCEN
jgi:heme exporter protein D